jgi:DNA-binding NarL/FixJ family response regulator
MIRSLRPDVALMDVRLPIFDGIEATRRNAADLPNVRVIGLSMLDDESSRIKIMKAGAVDCLDKSSAPSCIVEVVRAHGRAPSAERPDEGGFWRLDRESGNTEEPGGA